MLEYRIITGTSDDVEKGVNDMLKQGWQLYGNLVPGANGYFAQAVIGKRIMPAPDMPA